ncbi:hypothetical protein V5O48_011663 [Marasmius crinis-equi]|uniref:Uncharacterized protein n=1 Tax=Marasmius crinis-equi TaxID=585013 RepID=A0ABR3F5B9_9AGAR
MSVFLQKSPNDDLESIKLLDADANAYEDLPETPVLATATNDQTEYQKRTLILSPNANRNGLLSSWSIALPTLLSISLLLVALISVSAYTIPINIVAPTLILIQRLLATALFTDVATCTSTLDSAQMKVHAQPLFRGFASKYRNSRKTTLILALTTAALALAAFGGAVTSFVTQNQDWGEEYRQVCWLARKDKETTSVFSFGHCWQDHSILVQGLLELAQAVVLFASLLLRIL